MRKKIMDQKASESGLPEGVQDRLDLEQLARVEISSEAEEHPIEAAFRADSETGWVAAQPGEQRIRIVFDEPQQISRMHLLFREKEQERTQEFLLRWLPAGDQTYREIVRQPYNFSPPHTTEETEDYSVNLQEVQALELRIIPDVSGRNVRASLAQLQLFR